MQTETRVTLIFDPFDIYASGGVRVTELEDEERAFREIDCRLQTQSQDEMGEPLTVVVGQSAIQHFRTYRGIRGVRVEDFTPLRRVHEIVGQAPPEWLTDENVYQWGMLSLRPPEPPFLGSWEATVADWLAPNVAGSKSLDSWIRALSQSPSIPGIMKCEPVIRWFVQQFGSLGRTFGLSADEIDELSDMLTSAESPSAFARTWARRAALAPLLDSAVSNPLHSPNIDVLSPKMRFLMKRLPILFPLPTIISGDVCRLFRDAVRKARIRDAGQLEAAILRLNAVWEGITEEIRDWLDVSPRGLSQKAAEHLEKLPGFADSPELQEIVGEHRPPEGAPRWEGLNDNFDGWVSSYARWIRNAFNRRELPSIEDDPSTGFSRWLKDNYTVSFSHPERSYLTVAGTIRSALREGRTVLLVLIDAMAVHVLDHFRVAMSKALGEEPTRVTYVFAPIPTVTEVCKASIASGIFPDQCTGDLRADVAKAYGLQDQQLQVAANWADAQRSRILQETKLLVYRDNRVDDQLAMAGNYRELVHECRNIADRVSSLLRRLVDDCRCINGSTPLGVIPADHGFTYGPGALGGSGHEGSDQRHFYRCQALSSTERRPPADEHLTFLDKNVFRTRNDYVAARSRSWGSDTLSGWVMSHGGLLPEEVIIPLVEWYGKDAQIPWPTIDIVGDAYRERGEWLLKTKLRNLHAVPVPGGEITIGVRGAMKRVGIQFSRLQPGQTVVLDLKLPEANPEMIEELTVETTTEMHWRDSQPVQLDRNYSVSAARQLAERTTSQDAFESMF